MNSSIKPPKIEPSWLHALNKEFDKPYFKKLKTFLKEEKKEHTIYPKDSDIFNAFNYTPFDKVKVVIIGQDPYHGEGQAHGLSFSVPENTKTPPSLKNIYKELEQDVGVSIPNHGNLTKWAEQGVLMLNATLTVRKKTPGSHQKKGWEKFTDACIDKISTEKEGVVFLLWGNYAKEKGRIINNSKHHVLSAAHPSPFSAHNGFFGCKHFSKTNELLIKQQKSPINWQV